MLHAYGDGLASETLPPESVQGKSVILSISGSGPTIAIPNSEKQVSFQLTDANNNLVPNVTYAIVASKGDKPLFGHVFKSDTGKLLLNLVQYKTNQTDFQSQGITPNLDNTTESNTLLVNVVGPDFEAGLYRFNIMILTIYSYSNQIDPPTTYNAKISIPEYYQHQINDKTYGNQTIVLVGYYDTISKLQYDYKAISFNFTMPFDWSSKNLNGLSVVHQEIQIPRSLENFMTTKYDAYVNGMKLPDKSTIIDDYSSNNRIIHIILNNADIYNLSQKQDNSKQEMNFSLSPSREIGFPSELYTRDGQYKISLKWDPPAISPNSTVKFSFKILGPIIVNKSTGLNYDLLFVSENKTIFDTSGMTGGPQAENNVNVHFPANVTGSLKVIFENINGSKFANADLTTIIMPSVPEFQFTMFVLAISTALLLVFYNMRFMRHNIEFKE